MTQWRLESLVSPRLAWYPWSPRRAMSILRDAQKKDIEGSTRKEKPKPDTDMDIIEISDRNPVTSWRRFGIRTLMVVNMALRMMRREVIMIRQGWWQE